jgi:hypothetical protein
MDEKYLGLPQETLNQLINYLLGRPYREVSELLKAVESQVVTIQGKVSTMEAVDSEREEDNGSE